MNGAYVIGSVTGMVEQCGCLTWQVNKLETENECLRITLADLRKELRDVKEKLGERKKAVRKLRRDRR